MSNGRNRQVRRQNQRRLERGAARSHGGPGTGTGGTGVGLDGFDPVRIDTASEEPAEVKQVPLFYINGREYTIPSEFPPAIGLRYLRNVRDEGQDYAVAQVLTEVLGEDGFNDLADCDRVTREQMDRIVDIVTELAMGSVDGEGN